MLRDRVRSAALVSGLVLTALGLLLLLWPGGTLEVLARWWPTALTATGAVFLYQALWGNRRPSLLFGGLLFVLTGFFILLLSTGILPPNLHLKELWPVFLGIVGVSLIPYGARYRRTVRVTLVVPGIILLVLMVVFLLFSLQVVRQSFADFVIAWWPLLLVFMGLVLMVGGGVRRKP